MLDWLDALEISLPSRREIAILSAHNAIYRNISSKEILFSAMHQPLVCGIFRNKCWRAILGCPCHISWPPACCTYCIFCPYNPLGQTTAIQKAPSQWHEAQLSFWVPGGTMYERVFAPSKGTVSGKPFLEEHQEGEVFARGRGTRSRAVCKRTGAFPTKLEGHQAPNCLICNWRMQELVYAWTSPQEPSSGEEHTAPRSQRLRSLSRHLQRCLRAPWASAQCILLCVLDIMTAQVCTKSNTFSFQVPP